MEETSDMYPSQHIQAYFRMDLLLLMGTWELGAQSSFIFSSCLQTQKLPVGKTRKCAQTGKQEELASVAPRTSCLASLPTSIISILHPQSPPHSHSLAQEGQRKVRTRGLKGLHTYKCQSSAPWWAKARTAESAVASWISPIPRTSPQSLRVRLNLLHVSEQVLPSLC